MSKATPVEILRKAVESYAPYLHRSGEMHDPVFGEPTQYGTPYYALCNAVLAREDGNGPYIERAARGLGAALDHISNPSLPATASAFDRATGTVRRSNHRDFFWPPILKTYLILKDLGEEVEGFARRISGVDIEHAFAKLPPSNWAAVWLSGEWLRVRENLSPYSTEQIDDWLGPFFDSRILMDLGFYQEPGHPNSYDLFTRYHLADMLAEGYRGRWQGELKHLMLTGLRRSLNVQLSDGSLASAHRSTGQTWTLGAQCAYFTHAANYFEGRDPDLSQQAREAARRALSSFQRWQREGCPYSPVENRLPPEYRVGYERYTADGHYAILAASFLAVAVMHGFDSSLEKPFEEKSPSLHVEHDPTYRAITHRGRCSVHVNALPAPDYDGFGIVDLTFGPGRFLHFVSSVRHQESGRLYNLGLAHRPEAGRSEIEVIAQGDLVLIGQIERGDTLSSMKLEARPRGRPYRYRLAARIEDGGVRVEEATPGLRDYKTLLIPYLRDSGIGTPTELRKEGSGVRLVHGREEVEITFGAPVDRILHFPHGFENRRGLCGVLRVDFRDRSEGITYQVKAVR